MPVHTAHHSGSHIFSLHYIPLPLLRPVFTSVAAFQYIPRHLVLASFWLSLFLKSPKHIHRPTRFKNTASQSHQHMPAPGTSYLSVHHPRSTRRRRASASRLFCNPLRSLQTPVNNSSCKNQRITTYYLKIIFYQQLVCSKTSYSLLNLSIQKNHIANQFQLNQRLVHSSKLANLPSVFYSQNLTQK